MRRRPLDGESEFLALFARVAAGDAFAFSAAFCAPQCHAWTTATFRLCAAALACHLEGFKALALGQHWIAGRDLAFTTPFTITPPFALPGTPWLLLRRTGVGPFKKDPLQMRSGSIRYATRPREVDSYLSRALRRLPPGGLAEECVHRRVLVTA